MGYNDKQEVDEKKKLDKIFKSICTHDIDANNFAKAATYRYLIQSNDTSEVMKFLSSQYARLQVVVKKNTKELQETLCAHL